MTSTFDETALMFQRIYDNEKKEHVQFDTCQLDTHGRDSALSSHLSCIADLEFRIVSVPTKFIFFFVTIRRRIDWRPAHTRFLTILNIIINPISQVPILHLRN